MCRMMKTSNMERLTVRLSMTLCAAESHYVMSGVRSKDGKVAVWLPAQHVQDDEDKQHGEMDG
jgi:hypothetical protein